jgi:hypothetical protein
MGSIGSIEPDAMAGALASRVRECFADEYGPAYVDQAADQEEKDDRGQGKLDQRLAALCHESAQQGRLRGARHRTILPMMGRLCAPYWQA